MRHTLSRLKNQVVKSLKLIRDAKKLVEINRNNTDNFENLINNLRSFKSFNPSQLDSEVKYLFDLIKANRINTLCEIGSYKGGSLYLFCQAAPEDAQLISIDINYPFGRRRAHKLFAKKNQQITCIQGDTTDPKIVDRVSAILKDRPIDLLFIDGDHSLFGVMNDYVRYSPLVKEGGIIAFHDICPDMFMRTGEKSSTYVGGVPLFWELLKRGGEKAEEINESPYQDGYGIGIIYKEYN